MGAANNTGEPMEQDTEKKENESAESAAQEPASVESSGYHYTGSQVKGQDSQASTPMADRDLRIPIPPRARLAVWQSAPAAQHLYVERRCPAAHGPLLHTSEAAQAEEAPRRQKG